MVFPAIIPFLGGLISSAGAAIATSVASIGGALGTFATSVGGMIATAIEALGPMAKTLATFANNLLQALNILKPGETIEAFGEKALQAALDGKNLDDFDDFSEYMSYLRDYDIDPEKAEKRSFAEKLTAGLGIGTVAIEDKFNTEAGSLNALWLLPMVNPVYFTPERVESWISTGRLGGDLVDYLSKKLDGMDSLTFQEKLEVNEDGTRMDDAQQEQLSEQLDTAREGWANLQQQLQQYNSNR